MSRVIVEALHSNFAATFGLMRDTIRAFDDVRWRKAYTWFQVPVRVARHNLECVDFFFRDPSVPWDWGVSRFGKPYWETPNEEQPSQVQLLAYLDELEVRVQARFAALQDEDLLAVSDPAAAKPRTWLADYLYALRHAVHHQGSLAALADILDVPSGDWDAYES